jgi:nicotinamide-nucleotide amidase
MKSSLVVSTLAIGDELLDGRVADTNSQRLAESLFPLGIRIRTASLVEDDVDIIAHELARLTSFSDVVITSGGLGPTTDDLTAEAVAKAAGTDTRLDEESLATIRAIFEKRGIPMPPNNEGQALVPSSARVVQNGAGISPAFVTRVGDADVWSLPGVPAEYDWFVAHHVVEDVARRVDRGSRAFLARRTLRCLGVTESALGHALSSFERAHTDVRVQYRTRFPENHLRLIVEGETMAGAEARVDALALEVRALIGGSVYAIGDDDLESLVVARLRARGETIGVAESCTGGLLLGALTDVAGASAVVRGGIVAYANDVKTSALDVDAALIEKHGAVSEEVALAMAAGASARLGTTWAVSTTGIAGPSGGTPEKPVGTVCFGLVGPAFSSTKKRQLLMPGRARIRQMSVAVALRFVLTELERQSASS